MLCTHTTYTITTWLFATCPHTTYQTTTWLFGDLSLYDLSDHNLVVGYLSSYDLYDHNLVVGDLSLYDLSDHNLVVGDLSSYDLYDHNLVVGDLSLWRIKPLSAISTKMWKTWTQLTSNSTFNRPSCSFIQSTDRMDTSPSWSQQSQLFLMKLLHCDMVLGRVAWRLPSRSNQKQFQPSSTDDNWNVVGIRLIVNKTTWPTVERADVLATSLSTQL